ncbi:DUF3784 domain-containing protein [Chitinispirillales bacterium ANBcel5]|uniref:DUF3784 domain-containing protein n=1 Tax=Cellulosispirillum alkaliphilum TaxID=3039283 RepID=UPI002A4F002A|nr:DUF3784 domain-containing protein [Chitinispirillales bacterium ANBcel5]
MPEFISAILTATVLVLLGYLIKHKQWAFLISGYNTSSKQKKEEYDKEALCNGTGGLLFVLAAVLLLSSIGYLFTIRWIPTAGWIVFTLIIIGFLVYANTGNRYKKRSE